MYFKLALKLWVLSRSTDEQHLKKQTKCLTWVFILTNCIFAALLGVSMGFPVYKMDSDIVLSYSINSLLTVLPAILLIVSVCVIKRLIKILGGTSLSSRDRLMQAHTAVFLVYLIAYLCCQCVGMYYYLSADTSTPTNFTYECRVNFAADILAGVMELSIVATLILLAYMSIKFSQPVPDYIPDFLNKYENDHIRSSPHLSHNLGANSDRAAHSRWHQAAIRDANLRILSALATMTESQISSEDDDGREEASESYGEPDG